MQPISNTALSNINTILLAEDDLDDQDFITEALLNIKSSLTIYKVSKANEVLPFLTQLTDEQLPQLIILDYNLPEANGAFILELLTQNNRYQPITKIIWSTSNSPLYKTRSLQRGAAFYLVKPSTIAGIEAMARQMLGICESVI